MGYKPDWQNGTMKKSAGHKCSPGMQSRELFHGAKMANGGLLKGYADGGEADTSAVFKDTVTQKDSGYEPIQETASAAPAAEAPKNFGSAFKEARASGAKDFEWNGKKYTTQVKEEVKAAPKKPAFDIEDGKFMTDSQVRASADKADEDKIRNAKGGKFVQGATPSRQSTPAADTRTKEEKIKAAKGGKFVQGRTPE